MYFRPFIVVTTHNPIYNMLFGAHIAPIQQATTELFRVVEISWANWQVDVPR